MLNNRIHTDVSSAAASMIQSVGSKEMHHEGYGLKGVHLPDPGANRTRN